MILPVANVLSPDEVASMVERLGGARFQPGLATAGWHARLVKDNEQLRADDPAHGDLRAMVEAAVRRHPVVAMATRPRRFGPILFARAAGGQNYGSHVDDALMGGVRTDVSFTLFLAEPDTYEGGELVMETSAGDVAFKLPAGAGLFYPSTTLHRVTPVTSGQRLVAVGWIRSFIRDASEREMLFDLDTARQGIFNRDGKVAEFDLLSKCLSNLVRKWAED
ncbi:Fe2+-dependent dioxygenase [Niveispirillum sp. KHB5.9]|uniref:Fe2+-dependent dioxygenase n=1 Tax=Niveispirillum sp. KHB5.9 TaxID=3400269 RepID=UPI003A844252